MANNIYSRLCENMSKYVLRREHRYKVLQFIIMRKYVGIDGGFLMALR
jgi:hypothetical protein